jgi:transcriptional regulator with XRE-family HTH domain
MATPKTNNNLLVVRRRYGLTRKQVAHLLGYKSAASIGRIEQGTRFPDLRTLLGFEILYRTPAAYLYAQTYSELRDELRSKEAAALTRPRATNEVASEGGSNA